MVYYTHVLNRGEKGVPTCQCVSLRGRVYWVFADLYMKDINESKMLERDLKTRKNPAARMNFNNGQWQTCILASYVVWELDY